MKYKYFLLLLVPSSLIAIQGCPGSDPARSAPATPYLGQGGAGAAAAVSPSPADGAYIQAKHILFSFDAIPAAAVYQLQVYKAGDNAPVVKEYLSFPRYVARAGIEFGNAYAWHVRGLDEQLNPGDWQDFKTFSTAALPPNLQEFLQVENNSPEKVQHGLVLFNLDDVFAVVGGPYCVAVDENGDIVWFLRREMLDVRMLRNGNLLYHYNGEATESTLDGTILWTSADLGLDIDGHEIFDMPNGNVLFNVFEYQPVMRDGEPQVWVGQILTEITRDGEAVWTWNAFDHLSTLDFDLCIMSNPPFNGTYDWLHGNGLIYDATDRSVYYSIRHLSRIVKIDYDTGDIIYSLGADAPSGDTSFGDNLFSFQHAPEVLSNGNLLLYNNGNRRDAWPCGPPDPYSTAIEMRVDPSSTPPVSVAWEYPQDFFTNSRGDADKQPNGNTLICAGSSGRILEVTGDNEVVWELAAPVVMYRAEKILSLYPLRGDADGDGDIDLDDYNGFLACYGGAGNTAIHRDCLVHDYDEDGDVDMDDYSQLLANFTGPAF